MIGLAEWIMVVDDDLIVLKSAGQILSRNHMRVTGFQSGDALLRYLEENGFPDLILLDINMPGMNGFETLQKLRALEKDNHETPVIFLTGEYDQESEVRGFQAGAMDFLRKPFAPDILVERIQRVLRTQSRMNHFEHAAAIDRLTGMLSREATEDKMRTLCETETGFLCVLDLDTFKSVNDLYGHEMGDKVLELFSGLMKKEMRHDDVCGRIGGDEFVLFLRNMQKEEELRQFISRINQSYQSDVGLLIGSQLQVGVSAGAISVPEHGRDYATLFGKADEALYSVKQNGRHGICIAETRKSEPSRPGGELTLEAVTSVLEERTVPSSAMWMGTDAFVSIYQYMTRYMERYHGVAYRTLFTVRIHKENCTPEERAEIMGAFRRMMQHALRSSDVMVEVSDNQLFLLLPETRDYDIERVVRRLLFRWRESEYSAFTSVSYETGHVHLNRGEHEKAGFQPPADLVVIVDDDRMNLKVAEHVLSRNDNMQVACLTSGFELMDYLKGHKPDLILLDVKMPEMNGFETMERLKSGAMIYRDIPVIFLTAEDSRESEILGLKLGAIDFIRKPFIPEVLSMRVRNAIELTRLQYHLTQEVARKAAENSMLFLHVVRALAEAIDAKDTYTHGHSSRVAKYAREIAQRYGYSSEAVSNIYMMALVHDVGKIGVPDAVINKPGALTEEEFALIRQHPVLGAKILEAIREMPSLSVGARCHHERYDGRGYPDGLAGASIPEEARIIAVADAYDAMTSRRSYREALPQAAVRSEIENGAGTQFDPNFAKIMLQIMDEDPDYTFRE